MISATYFGEIAELDSRAVWYSDEEDDDEDTGIRESKSSIIEPVSHEVFRSTTVAKFTKVNQLPDQTKFATCIISLTSSAQFHNHKLNELSYLGFYDSFGKAYVFLSELGDNLLWLLFDSSNPNISGHQVGYIVENLREHLQSEFNLDHSSRIIILSQQFSNNENLEYLSNFHNTNSLLRLPFTGSAMLPPSIIRSQFESAFFEQFTLSLTPALLASLPDPKNFCFDSTKCWPTMPKIILELKLNDDLLDKTLIFT